VNLLLLYCSASAGKFLPYVEQKVADNVAQKQEQ
jgi:hypothetical protein